MTRPDRKKYWPRSVFNSASRDSNLKICQSCLCSSSEVTDLPRPSLVRLIVIRSACQERFAEIFEGGEFAWMAKYEAYVSMVQVSGTNFSSPRHSCTKCTPLISPQTLSAAWSRIIT